MAKTNLKELAAKLGVSISTVSKALKDSHEIGVQTKQRVLEMADQLGYRANPYAGHLHSNKSKTIAVVIPEINNNFFIQAISGAESIAKEQSYHVLIYVTNDNFKQEESILKHLQNGRVDGVLMSLSSHTKTYDHINTLLQYKIPVVFFDRICHEIETAKITTDDFANGFIATEHLIKNGCRDIAYLSVSDNLSIDNKRKQGYLEALHKYDLPIDASRVIQCWKDETDTYKKIKKLLQGNKIPDGIFSSVEKMALTTYRVCQNLKINIPETVKVICFSNLRTADLLSPSLTTITQPAYEMGKLAAFILFRQLIKNATPLANENIVLKSKLNIRDSTKIN
jgi:LacI family transcriptional regulator